MSAPLLEVIADTPRPPIEMLAALPGVEDVQAFGERAHVRVAAGTQALGVTTVTGALRLQRYDRRGMATEDVFIALITRSADDGSRDADLADRAGSPQGGQAERHS